MAKATDTVKELEAILMMMKDQLSELKPGSEDYARQIKGICELQHELTEHKKAIDQAKHNEENRVEQKRMNDEELKHKNCMLGIEMERNTNMREIEKWKRCDNLIINGLRLLFDGGRELKYEARWREVMNAEYNISDGASYYPAGPVKNILTENKPKMLG